MGTSRLVDLEKIADEDHPHAYGDKKPVTADYSPDAGSSPRVWGQDPTVIIAQKACRIIPTRMGTSGRYKQV